MIPILNFFESLVEFRENLAGRAIDIALVLNKFKAFEIVTFLNANSIPFSVLNVNENNVDTCKIIIRKNENAIILKQENKGINSTWKVTFCVCTEDSEFFNGFCALFSDLPVKKEESE